MNRVFLHGCSSLTSGGACSQELWDSLMAGQLELQARHGFAIASLSVSSKIKLQDLSKNKAFKDCDPAVQLGFLSAMQATANTKPVVFDDRSRVGVFFGSARGATTTLEAQYQNLKENDEVGFLTSPMTTSGVFSSIIARNLELSGPTASISAACTTSLHAIAIGFSQIIAGLVDSAICGGSEMSCTEFTVRQLGLLKVLKKFSSDQYYQHLSFSEERAGMVLGEGAASVVLSEKESPIELIGIGCSTEQGSQTGLSSEGLASAITKAFQHAKIQPQDLDFIVGHGSATKLGDSMELQAYRQVFKGPLPQIFSTKWITGHPLGASGAVAVDVAKAIFEHQKIPVIPYNTNVPKPANPNKPLKVGMVCALGFGGNAVCLIFRKTD